MNNIQKELLQLLIIFDSFCVENKLKYHLAYGTLLGAVRHEGFIPWDDDIDIIMPLEDYNKLISMANSMNGLFLQSIETDPTYFYLFAKLKFANSNSIVTNEDKLYGRKQNGVWIDIFPCINIPNIDSRCFKRWKRKRMHICTLLALKAIPFKKAPLIKKIAKPFTLLLSRKSLIKAVEKSSIVMNKKESPFLYVQDFWSPDEKCFLTNYSFSNSRELLFEGYYFKAPIDYDIFLKNYYGDYMTPPPINQRHGHNP